MSSGLYSGTGAAVTAAGARLERSASDGGPDRGKSLVSADAYFSLAAEAEDHRQGPRNLFGCSEHNIEAQVI